MTNAPPLDGLSCDQEAARTKEQDRALGGSGWWSEFYAGDRNQST